MYRFTVRFNHFVLDMPGMIAKNADFQQIFNQRLSYEFTSHVSQFLLDNYNNGYDIQLTVHADNTKDMVLIIEIQLKGPPAIFDNLRSTIIPFLKRNQSDWIKGIMKDITYIIKPKIKSGIRPSEQERVHEIEEKMRQSLPPIDDEDDDIRRNIFLNIDKDTFIRTLYLISNRPYIGRYHNNVIKTIVNAAVKPERTNEQYQDAMRTAQQFMAQLMAQQVATQESMKKKKSKSKSKTQIAT